jgi:hypothetical protein
MSVEGYSTAIVTNTPTIQTMFSGHYFPRIVGRLTSKGAYVRPGIFKLTPIHCTVLDMILRVEMANISDFRVAVAVPYFRLEMAEKVVRAYL